MRTQGVGRQKEIAKPDYKDWFVKAFRGVIPEDVLGVMQFLPIKRHLSLTIAVDF